MTWPHNLQTRFCLYTGIPLDSLHWNHTGWCYHPMVSQWQSSVNSLRPSDAYMRRQSSHRWFRWWLVACSAPGHYLNRCWNILIGHLGTNLSEIRIAIQTFSLTKIHLKMSSAKWLLFCLGLNVLIDITGTHWKTTGATITLGCHWNHTGWC